MISEQIRATRTLLGWSARQLAEESGVHLTTVQRLERGNGLASGTVMILVRIQDALEDAGVEFTSPHDEIDYRCGAAFQGVKPGKAYP